MKRKFRYLRVYDQAEIERLHNREATVAVIADKEGEVITGHRALLPEQNTLCEVVFVPHRKNC